MFKGDRIGFVSDLHILKQGQSVHSSQQFKTKCVYVIVYNFFIFTF